MGVAGLIRWRLHVITLESAYVPFELEQPD